MQRETKQNLFFLIVLMVVMIPGGVILFIKKLDPNASRMSLPDPVRKPLPFMAPIGRPGEGEGRIMPEETGQWLDKVVLDRAGTPLLLVNHRPLISEDRRVQVAALPPAGRPEVALIVWTPDGDTLADAYAVECQQGGARSTGRVLSAEAVEIPERVRKELVNGGFNQPPHRVIWLKVGLPEGIVRTTPVELTLTFGKAEGGWKSGVKLFGAAD